MKRRDLIVGTLGAALAACSTVTVVAPTQPVSCPDLGTLGPPPEASKRANPACMRKLLKQLEG